MEFFSAYRQAGLPAVGGHACRLPAELGGADAQNDSPIPCHPESISSKDPMAFSRMTDQFSLTQ